MRIVFVILVCQTLAFAAPATAPSTSPSDSVDRLIAQLSADEWRERQAAENALVDAGAAVVPRLQRVADESPSDEARQRATTAITRIQSQARLGPSLITLHVKDAHPRDVYAELARQAAATLQPWPPELWDIRPWNKLTLDVQEQPFWRVMRTLSEQTGIDLRQWGNDGQLRLMSGMPGATSAGRWTISGPFLVSLLRCARSQLVDYTANDATTSNFELVFTVAAEPKLRVLRASYSVKLEEATDERGNSLVPADDTDAARAADAPMVSSTGGMWQLTARLNYPKDIGTKIVKLRGSAGVVLQTRYETIEIPDILSAGAVSRSAGGLVLSIKQLKRIGDRYELSASIARDRASPLNVDWDRVQQALPDIKLLDDRQRPLLRASFASGGNEETVDVTASYIPADPSGLPQGRAGEPSKLVWQIATETREVLVPFEFYDVPLPK